MSEINKMPEGRKELFKRLYDILGESVDTTFEKAELIDEALNMFKQNGFKVKLNLEFTLLFDPTYTESDIETKEQTNPLKIVFSAGDLKFLETLQINPNSTPEA
jgi:hypothetical protein